MVWNNKKYIATRESYALSITQNREEELHLAATLNEKEHVLAMKLHPGMDLNEMMTKKNFAKEAKPIHLLNMFISMLDSLSQIHEKNLIHRDIKPHNMIYDSVEQTVKLADFGFAMKKEEKFKSFAGNTAYAAPNLQTKLDYSTQSDIYALGICMGEMLGFSRKDTLTKSLKLDRNPLITGNKTPFPDNTCFDMFQYLQKLTASTASERPSVAETKVFFEQIKTHYLQTLDLIHRVICLDIDEYNRATTDEKMLMHKQLKKADEVWFIDSSKGKYTPFEYAKLQHQFHKIGILVGRDVIQADSPTNYEKPLAAYQHRREDKNNNIYICSVLTKNGSVVEPTIVSKVHFNRIIKNLSDDMARLNATNEKEKEKHDRADLIDKFIKQLQQQKDKLSYTGLEKELTQLQKDLLSKSSTVRFLQNLSITLFDTNSRKNVNKQLDELKKAKKLSR